MPNHYKNLFPGARYVAYLDTAAEGLPLAEGGAALTAYFHDKSLGSHGRRRFHPEEELAQTAASRLLGTDPENVTLVSSSSEGLNILANSIDWEPGDEVLISDLEFPSGVLAWLRLKNQGVSVRVLPSECHAATLESFQNAISRKTRVVMVSHVSYKTGARISFLPELASAAHAVGALLVVDATQSLGRVPVSVDGVDFLVASTYKWLLGVHGLGVAYLSPQAREQLNPGALGWYSVSDLFSPYRFERYTLKPGAEWLSCGMPAFPSIYVLRRSMEFLLETGVERIEADLRPLVSSLRNGIRDLDYDLITPPDASSASGIVSFACSDCMNLAESLEKRGVVVWAGDGRVRASVHLYNDQSDIDRCLHALASYRDEAPENTACVGTKGAPFRTHKV